MSVTTNSYIGIFLVIPSFNVPTEVENYIATKQHIIKPSHEIRVNEFYAKFGKMPTQEFFVIYGVNDKLNYLFLSDNEKYGKCFEDIDVPIEIQNTELLVSEFEREYKDYIDCYKSNGFDVYVKYGIVNYYN
jgi:hypothetical protein